MSGGQNVLLSMNGATASRDAFDRRGGEMHERRRVPTEPTRPLSSRRLGASRIEMCSMIRQRQRSGRAPVYVAVAGYCYFYWRTIMCRI